MSYYYVNVYFVGRAYGGPEEGGWYYDEYEPESASSPFRSKAAAQKVARTLGAEIEKENEEDRRRGRGERRKVKIETHPARYSNNYKPYE